MSGWYIVTWLSAGVATALLFLGLIADELSRKAQGLDRLEQRERRAYEKTLEAGEVVETLHPVAS